MPAWMGDIDDDDNDDSDREEDEDNDDSGNNNDDGDDEKQKIEESQRKTETMFNQGVLLYLLKSRKSFEVQIQGIWNVFHILNLFLISAIFSFFFFFGVYICIHTYSEF